MSISEARRQLKKAQEYARISEHSRPDESEFIGYILSHGFSAIVEALASNDPYDGTLNTIRVPFSVLRAIILEAGKEGLEDIGLEDLIIAIRARVRNLDVDS